MSSKLFKGSVITSNASKPKPVKLLRTQTAKQAKAAIVRKYGSIVASAEYYHKGYGIWVKYNASGDKKRTSKNANENN